MNYRTLEISKRLEEFDGNLEEFDCDGMSCLDCPFYNSNIHCEEFDNLDLQFLAKFYLKLPLKEE